MLKFWQLCFDYQMKYEEILMTKEMVSLVNYCYCETVSYWLAN